jgi:hypothetical protein
LFVVGLAGTDGSAHRRLLVGRKLRIGYANAKTFLKRCAMFGIRRKEIAAALAACGWPAEEWDEGAVAYAGTNDGEAGRGDAE